MRMTAFAARNFKEIMRDPLTLLFGMGLPLVILCLFALIQKNVPVELFRLDMLTPGIAVFSFSFVSLFSGMLIAKDRSTSFLMRIFASPMTAWDYILGYTLPLLPVGMMQSAVCFLAAFLLGLPLSVNVLMVFVVLLPVSLLYIGVGLLLGSLFSDRQAGGIFSIFINVTTWLSGTWFDLGLAGNAFKAVGYALPFAHAVDMARAALAGDFAAILPHLLWVLGYAAAVFAVAVVVFKKKMKG